MELEIKAFVISVPIPISFPIPIPMPRFTDGPFVIKPFQILSPVFISISHENTIEIPLTSKKCRLAKFFKEDAWSQALHFTGEKSFSSRFFFNILETSAQIEKLAKYQSSFPLKGCSKNFQKIHRKTIVVETQFSKVYSFTKIVIHRKHFSVNFQIIISRRFFKEHSSMAASVTRIFLTLYSRIIALSWLLLSFFTFVLSSQNDQDYDKLDEESEEHDGLHSSNVFLKRKNKLKKKGRKYHGSENLVNDLVDIAVENNKYKQKYKECKERSLSEGFLFDTNQTSKVSSLHGSMQINCFEN